MIIASNIARTGTSFRGRESIVKVDSGYFVELFVH
jgi:hypothetical protein